MSFLSILKTIGTTVLGIEKTAAPILELIPGISGPVQVIDGIFQRVQQAIQTVEQTSPVAGGQLKSGIVIQDFQAGLSLAQSILALEGKQVTYDASALQDAINSQVAAYNAMAKLKASFTVVPVAKAK